MRISDWSSDVCPSDLITHERDRAQAATARAEAVSELLIGMFDSADPAQARGKEVTVRDVMDHAAAELEDRLAGQPALLAEMDHIIGGVYVRLGEYEPAGDLLRRGLELRRQLHGPRSEEHTSELQSLMCISYAVFCLKKKKKTTTITKHTYSP